LTSESSVRRGGEVPKERAHREEVSCTFSQLWDIGGGKKRRKEKKVRGPGELRRGGVGVSSAYPSAQTQWGGRREKKEKILRTCFLTNPGEAIIKLAQGSKGQKRKGPDAYTRVRPPGRSTMSEFRRGISHITATTYDRGDQEEEKYRRRTSTGHPVNSEPKGTTVKSDTLEAKKSKTRTSTENKKVAGDVK